MEPQDLTRDKVIEEWFYIETWDDELVVSLGTPYYDGPYLIDIGEWHIIEMTRYGEVHFATNVGGFNTSRGPRNWKIV